MSNHYHLVVKLDPQGSEDWSEKEVFDRWTALFKGPLLVRRFLAGESLAEVESETLGSIAVVYRQRLGNLSWFMKCLNEPIARQANAEDKVTGHFWEARFHSQALKTEKALFGAMAYVDLNPIRAGIARTPEQSDYTSIKARLSARKDNSDLEATIADMIGDGSIQHFNVSIRPLMPFVDTSIELEFNSVRNTQNLPMQVHEYLKLVDETGRIISSGKRGFIDPELQPILSRLGLSSEDWAEVSTNFRHAYRNGDVGLKRLA